MPPKNHHETLGVLTLPWSFQYIYIYRMYHCSGYFFFFFFFSNFWMNDYSRDKPCEEAMTVTNSCIRPVVAGDLAGWAFWAKASLPQPISWRDFPSLGSNLRRCFCSWWPVPYFGSLSNWAVTNTFIGGYATWYIWDYHDPLQKSLSVDWSERFAIALCSKAPWRCTGSLSEYERRKLYDPQRSYAEALNLNLCVLVLKPCKWNILCPSWFQIRFTVETQG